jgi:drug/metabolite transporter (DMT)-like permease
MSGIEPNIQALAWFVAFWSLCCLGFFQLAGLYPLRRQMPALSFVVVTTTALWIALLAATVRFAVSELRWTTTIIVAGILFLFVPEIFQALPRRFRDGPSGLVVSACAFVVALLLLTQNLVGAPPLT